jgi:YbbR domain-containing protein
VEFDRAEVERCLGVLGISAMSISPASVTLRMEPRMERVVELEAVTVGEPAVGFFVEPGDVRIQPPKARIAGARSSVEAISAVKTAPVRIDGLNKDLRTETELARIERPFVEVEPKRVAVEVPVREKVIDAEAQVSPVPIQGCMEGMHCFSVPERVLVRLHGPYRAVKAAEPNPAGIVYVDASRYKRSGVFPAVRLRLRAPEGVVVKPEPAVVSFFVEKLGEVQEVIEEGDEQEGENP